MFLSFLRGAAALVLCLAFSISASASWSTSTSKDQMTGKVSAYAMSDSIPPTKRMGFPYHKVQAWLGVGCDGKSEWAYFGFSSSPNISNTETKSGYSLINTRIKWDNTVEDVKLSQDWGAKFIHFDDDKRAIAGIEKSGSVMIELDWHGEGSTYFVFPLKGSSKALAAMRKSCK